MMRGRGGIGRGGATDVQQLTGSGGDGEFQGEPAAGAPDQRRKRAKLVSFRAGTGRVKNRWF